MTKTLLSRLVAPANVRSDERASTANLHNRRVVPLARPETGFGDEVNERKTEIIFHVAPNLGDDVHLHSREP